MTRFKEFSIAFFTALLFVGFTLVSTNSSAQSKSNKGTEFWLGFMFHYEGNSAGHSLYITSDSSTSGTVSVPGASWSSNFTVTANNLTVVTIPASVAYNGCSDCTTSKGVKVTSLENVVVYAHQYLGNQSDATLVLPTRTLGKVYYAAAYDQSSASSSRGRSTFIVVATQDSTKVRITPTIDIQKGTATSSTGSKPANTSYEVILDEGEVYQGYGRYATSSDDVTGTKIEVIDTGASANCRKVAVFSGSSYTRVGQCSGRGFNSGDNLYEQMFPTNSWGSKFVLVPADGRSGDNFRFIASENTTEVIVFNSGGPPDIYYLDAGEYSELDAETNVRNVIATKPIMAVQYQRTAKCDGGGNRTGDPSMTVLNPLEQTLNDITVYSSRYYDIDNHYINVVIPAWAASSFRIDGSAASFTGVPGNAGYSYAKITVNAGNHRLKADGGFIATAYGEGQYESYGYAAGANVRDLTAVASVTNSVKNTEISNCIGRLTAFKGEAEYTPVSWKWFFDDGDTSLLQNPTHLFTDTGRYEVKMYAYKPTFDGCQNYDSSIVEVRIYDKPEASISYGNICDSNSVLFTENSSFPSPETHLTSKWSIDGGAFSYSRTRSQYFDTIGKFDIFMEVTSVNGCRDTIQDSLVVNPLPNPSFTKNNSCFYDSTFFTNTSSVLTGDIVLHSWEFSTGDGSLESDPAYFLPDSGWFYVTYTPRTDSGCFSNSITDSVYKYPPFDVSYSYNDTCLGFGNVFTNTTLLEGGSFTDTAWYISTLDTAYTYNYASTFTSVGDVTVQLVMEQDSFCRDTFTQIIAIHPLVVPNFSYSETCFGDSTLFTDLSSVSNGTYTRDWSFSDGFFGSAKTEKVEYSTGGQKTVTLTLTSDENCVTDTTRAVLITNPKITSINLLDGCQGTTQSISSTNSLGLDSFDTYSWTVNDTVVSTDSMFDYTPTTDGFIVVHLDVVSKNGCSISNFDSFESYTAPSANFFINSVCNNVNLTPIDNSNISAPSTIISYNWFANGVPVSTEQNPSIPTTVAGSIPMKLRIESDNGCKDSIEKQAIVHPLPIAGFNAADLCLGDVTILTSTASLNTGSITSTAWQVDGKSQSGTKVSYQFPTANTYSIEQIVSTDRSCKDTILSNVIVSPLPVIDATLDEYEGCDPFDITTINNSTIPSPDVISSFMWFWGDGSSNAGFEPSHTYTPAGSYSLKVIGTSDKGCIDSLSIATPVTVFANPIADFYYTPDDPSNLTDFVTFIDSSSTDVVQWDWSTSDGGIYSGTPAFHTFIDSGTYSVKLLTTNANGCEDEKTKFIYVNADLFVHIPNAFSPNGDFINDTYGLGGLTQGVEKLRMTIYNRWGEQVFYTEDVNKKWDGNYNGSPAQQGVYVYMIQFTNPKQTRWYYYNGVINLLR